VALASLARCRGDLPLRTSAALRPERATSTTISASPGTLEATARGHRPVRAGGRPDPITEADTPLALAQALTPNWPPRRSRGAPGEGAEHEEAAVMGVDFETS
jgi:hypothetical protein